MYFFDEVAEHRFGDFKFGDNAVAQGANGNDVGGGSSHHFSRFRADSERLASSFADGNPGGFVEDDATVAHADECIGCAEVYPDIKREETEEPVEGTKVG